MLRREAEKLQEQMAQMERSGSQQGASGSSSQSQPGDGGDSANAPFQQALERLGQANDDMRHAASPEQSGADARRAAERLREAANLLNNLQSQDASQRLGSVAREGERLASEQRVQAVRTQRAFDPSEVAKRAGQGQSEAAFRELEKLSDDRQQLAKDLSRLENQIEEATRQLVPGQRAAASRLRDALSAMQQSELAAKVRRSADMIRRGVNPNGSSEAAITAGIEHLNEQLRQTQQSLGSGQQDPEEALDRVARLRDQIDALTRGLRSRGSRGDPLGQAGQGGLSRAGEGMRDGPTAGYNGSRWDGDRFYGGYDPGGYTRPQGTERKPVPITRADIERAYQEALRDLNEMRHSVRGEPGQLGDIQELLREVSRLDPRRFPGNPAMLNELHAQVLSSVDKLELQIRREMDNHQPGQIRTADVLHVPDGYQDSVAEYFRRLSKRP
jgi:hypothetical protein